MLGRFLECSLGVTWGPRQALQSCRHAQDEICVCYRGNSLLYDHLHGEGKVKAFRKQEVVKDVDPVVWLHDG